MPVVKLHRTVGVKVGAVQVGGGAPIVVFPPANYQYGQGAFETDLVSSPDQKTVLLRAPQGAQTPVIRDSHGFWEEADQLYFNSVPVSAVQGQLAGACA